MVRKAFQQFDYSQYDYIGCIDDDQITDVWNLNLGLNIARRYGFRLWQLSMASGSDLFYPCLAQNPSITFSETNFIECGVPVFRRDKFKLILDVLEEWNRITPYEQAWGMDKAYCDIAESHAHVVHSASIFHPPRQAYYDKTSAMYELNWFMTTGYQQICQNLFGREPVLVDNQTQYFQYKIG